MPTESTEIATTTAGALTNRFDPQTFDELVELSEKITASGLVPDSVKKPEDALVIMMTGAELGLTTMQALRTIHVVKGRPILSADLMLSLVRQHHLCERFERTEWTDQACEYETKRADQKKAKPFRFTMEDARRAGLTNRNVWKKHPKQMLRASALRTLARAEYPEVLSGVYTPDEAPEIRAGEAQIVEDGEAVDTDDPNERYGNEDDSAGDDTDDPTDDAVDVEFEEAEDAVDGDVDRETQNRRLGQLVATTDDLDNDDKRWIADAIADQCNKDSIGDVGPKALKLVVDLLYKQGSTPEDGEMSGRRQMLEEWRGDGEDGGEGGDSEYVV